MANLFVVVALLCIAAIAKANPVAEYVEPGYGLGYGGYAGLGHGGYGAYPEVHSAGVLGGGAYIPGAGFIPGYPFTYMRDSYGGHAPPSGHDGYYGNGGYGDGYEGYGAGYGGYGAGYGGYGAGYGGYGAGYGGYGAGYGGYGAGYGGYGAPAVYGPVLHGGYSAPLVKGIGYRR